MKKASIIIPTYQGANRIHLVLDSLLNQTCKNFEVIVVIDGSMDATKSEILKYDERLDITIVEQQNKGRAGARNSGVMKSTASILIFFDDDVVASSNTVEAFVSMSQQHNVIQGGIEAIYAAGSEFENYANYLNNMWMKSIPSETELEYPYLSACNFSITKSLYDSIGGFDERLRDAEDRDLAIRLVHRGEKIYYAPNISVAHKLQKTFLEYAARMADYRSAITLLNTINPLTSVYFPETIISKWKKVCYYFLSSKFWILCVDKGLFTFLPERVRFKIYTIFLVAYSLYVKRT
jgi:glycosyltransferase involved in cell wall biosynthesis